jgi:transcriptional regulator with XRE-family HTH domain
MAIGERIRFFRNKKGVTQKYLGQVVGFPERSADVRMAQYETGSRTPKADLTRTLAGFFEVSTDALTVPDIDSDIGLMHTLFALEDIRGLTIGEIDGEICLRLDKSKGGTYLSMLEMLSRWANEAKKLEAGEITREEYDHWRYTYPAVEAQRTRDRLDALRAKQKAAETDE